jgi:urease accessory protein
MIDVTLLQLVDGLFPAGGYAHSLGLETYAQEGIVRDRAGVEAFVLAHLEGGAGPCDAVAVTSALRHARAGDLAACEALDATLEAMKPARPLREASAQMGRQALRALAAISDDARLAAFRAAVEARRTPGHHAVVFGLAGAAFGWAPEDAAAGFLYQGAAMLVGASLRLLALGQVDGQRTLAALGPAIARLARAAADAAPGDLASFGPGLEVAAMRHERLDARLFRS